MSRQELRRRLHAVDPNLKILYGKRSYKSHTEGKLVKLPKILSDVEAEWWGLGLMIPDFPSEEILAIEAKWSKKDLQRMAEENMLETWGDKELLIHKLRYIGVLDKKGEYIATEQREKEPVSVPSVLLYASTVGDPIKQFCCRLCGDCAPANLLQEGRFLDRISWLRKHYTEQHPGKWGKAVKSLHALQVT